MAQVKSKTKKALVVTVVLLICLATIAVISASGPDKAAGKICKAGFENQGYTCPWSAPWWWPFSDCTWYGLTCAQSAG